MRSFSVGTIAMWISYVAGLLMLMMWCHFLGASWMTNWSVYLDYEANALQILDPLGQLAFLIFPIHHYVANLVNFVSLVHPWNCSTYLMRGLYQTPDDDCCKIMKTKNEVIPIQSHNHNHLINLWIILNIPLNWIDIVRIIAHLMFVLFDGERFGLLAKSIPVSFSFVCAFKLTPSSLDSHSSRIMSSSSLSECSSACELLCKKKEKSRTEF